MTAIIFPGQGSQFVGMSRDFYDNFESVRKNFELISDITKFNIKKIIFENTNDFLNQTKYTQLAIFCASISIYETLNSEAILENLNISCMFGHSLGEYTALTALGIISIEDCALLLKKRGQLMQDAYEPNKSGMAAIIGLDCKKVEQIIVKNKLIVDIANDNSPLQIVISGIKDNLLKSEHYFKEGGSKKFIMLNVSAGFHSYLMIDAQKKMKDFIINTNFNSSKIPLISNFDAQISNNKEIIIENLSKQMSNRVRWAESIKTLSVFNENDIIEIGPGKVLTGLIKRNNTSFNILNIENINDIKNIQ